MYAGEIQEVESYLVEEKQLPTEIEEIRADVAMVAFKLPDIRTELERIKIVQDVILVAMLEGGE